MLGFCLFGVFFFLNLEDIISIHSPLKIQGNTYTPDSGLNEQGGLGY